MILASIRTGTLIQRLRERAARLAARRAATQPRGRLARKAEWYSAAALWPDFTGDSRDGK